MERKAFRLIKTSPENVIHAIIEAAGDSQKFTWNARLSLSNRVIATIHGRLDRADCKSEERAWLHGYYETAEWVGQNYPTHRVLVQNQGRVSRRNGARA